MKIRRREFVVFLFSVATNFARASETSDEDDQDLKNKFRDIFADNENLNVENKSFWALRDNQIYHLKEDHSAKLNLRSNINFFYVSQNSEGNKDDVCALLLKTSMEIRSEDGGAYHKYLWLNREKTNPDFLPDTRITTSSYQAFHSSRGENTTLEQFHFDYGPRSDPGRFRTDDERLRQLFLFGDQEVGDKRLIKKVFLYQFSHSYQQQEIIRHNYVNKNINGIRFDIKEFNSDGSVTESMYNVEQYVR